MPSETTRFVVRNWGMQFADFAFCSAKWWNRAFCKKAILDAFGAFFFRGSSSAFFFVCGVLVHGGEVEEVRWRETLQNKGFQSYFASLDVFDSSSTSSIASILQTFFENNFCASYKFDFLMLEFWTKVGSEGKNALGAVENRGRFENGIFQIFRASANLRKCLGARVLNLGSEPKKNSLRREQENRKTLFSPASFIKNPRLQELIRGPVFFYRPWPTSTFLERLFLGSSFKGIVHRSDIILQN